MSGQSSRMLGRWGEALAADYLRERGYKIVEAGWRCRFGEIDLIATDRRYICFVEVKLRKSDAYGSAAAFVDFRKQEKLRTSAQMYLSEHTVSQQPRFDVIEVYAPVGMRTAQPKITHLENAF